MSDAPTVVIVLEGDSRVHRPGEKLTGEYWIESLDAEHVKAVEASVLWYTEGKGDVDMAVHEFWRRNVDKDGRLDPRQPEPFETVLPNSPLSYEGQIVKLHWCVRVRVLMQRGKDVVGEKRFELGHVAAPRLHRD